MPDPTQDQPPRPQPDNPPSVEAVLTESDLDDLFRDLAACAELRHIAVRSAPDQANAIPAPLDLVTARALLDGPEVCDVQLRYIYNEILWIDTLTQRPDGCHLLRVRHA